MTHLLRGISSSHSVVFWHLEFGELSVAGETAALLVSGKPGRAVLMRVQSWKLIPFLAVSLLFFTAIETRAAAPTITSLSPTSGAVGASVTITGTNFGSSQGTSTVKFNGTSATTTSWSATSIVAAVPTGATTGNVVVTVSGTASNGKSFTVVSAP